jgi:hypothetical protein
MGYDPLLQFVHEVISQAIELCRRLIVGVVQKVAWAKAITYRKAVELVGARAFPVPHFLVYGAMGALSRFRLSLPKHLGGFRPLSAAISTRPPRVQKSGYQPRCSTQEALKSLRSLRCRRAHSALELSASSTSTIMGHRAG